jgi:integrase/recombinase XerC
MQTNSPQRETETMTPRPQIIEDFLRFLSIERHFSSHTAKSYTSDLGQFCDFLAQPASPDQSPARHDAGSGPPEHSTGIESQMSTTAPVAETAVVERPQEEQAPTADDIQKKLLGAGPDVLRRFLAALREQDYSNATVARKVATLRSFYKYLYRRGVTTSNPAVGVRAPKIEKRLPKFMDLSHVERLLQSPDDRTVLGARDRAILETLYSTGLRVSEVVDLDVSDVDFDSEILRVRAKGRRERIAPIGPTAIEAIKTYLSMRATQGRTSNPDGESGPLFLNKLGRRLSARSVRRKLDKYLVEAGLDPAISPHTLRHTFATHMINAGADLRSVQELLGHQSISTTQIYTHLADAKLKQEYDDAHPRS